MEDKSVKGIEHHLVLKFDELDKLPELFNIGAKSLEFDVKGHKTLQKNVVYAENGINVCNHAFVNVSMTGCVADDPQDVTKLLATLTAHGATTCYLTRLRVTWEGESGAVIHDDWTRKVIGLAPDEIVRTSNIRRMNTLTISADSIDELKIKANRYAEDSVGLTDCLLEFVSGKTVRTCKHIVGLGNK